MPSPAFARPLWPATLRALRELTRFALASLVLAVGLGGAMAVDPPAGSATVSPVSATVAIDAPASTLVAVRPVVEPGQAVDDGPGQRESASTVPSRTVRAEAASTDAAAVDRVAAPVPAARAGEPTRRGPPAG
ncbi:hypothetical protein GCM10029963_41200 [Micromonospora andamanensis]|uniref:hypothetical protein n=1 Tax=Micromonospora andamanensis TaxID=1287068 RepID=UPI0019522E27|nr:hypothetical protein [Micromonospora andamanensis]GIJ37000.1 hypothetical protein Vwe01_03250 [Micromonospora andamanensis]